MPNIKRNYKKIVGGWLYDNAYRFFVLSVASVLMLVGFMSLMTADPIVKFTLGSLLVFFVAKELY